MEQNNGAMQRQGCPSTNVGMVEKALQPFVDYDPRYNQEGNGAQVGWMENLVAPNSMKPDERRQAGLGEAGFGSLQLPNGQGQMKLEPNDPSISGNKALISNPRKKLEPQFSWCPEEELGAYGFDPHQSRNNQSLPSKSAIRDVLNHGENLGNGRQRHQAGKMMNDYDNACKPIQPKSMASTDVSGYSNQEASASTNLELDPTLSLANNPDTKQRKILTANRGKPGTSSRSRPDVHMNLKYIEEEMKKAGLNGPIDKMMTGQGLPPSVENLYHEQHDENMTGLTIENKTMDPKHTPKNEDDDNLNEAVGEFLRNYASTMNRETGPNHEKETKKPEPEDKGNDRIYKAVGKFLKDLVNTMKKNEPGTNNDNSMNHSQINEGTGTKQKNQNYERSTELRNPEVYIPPMPEPSEIRAKYLSNEETEFGKLNDFVNRYEATYMARRNIYMMVVSMKKQPGDEQFYSTGIDHLKETNEELVKLYRKIQTLSTKLENIQDDDYIEMPKFGTTDKVDMKALQALPKYDPERKDITLHQFWMKVAQFVNITQTSEEATKYILIYLLEGQALDTFEMNKEKPIKEIIKQLKENFGGMPTKLEYEEQMVHFSRGPKESIKSAMNRFEYIVKKLYLNEKDSKQIVEMKCKETVKKIALHEAKERLDRAEMEAKANGTELTYEDRLKIISMEEDIIEKRNVSNQTANFMQMVRYEPGYYHPRKFSHQIIDETTDTMREARKDYEEAYDYPNPRNNSYVEHVGFQPQVELFEQEQGIDNANQYFNNDMYHDERPKKAMEINTSGNEKMPVLEEDYASDDDDNYVSEDETSEEEFEDTPVEAKINTLLKLINKEETNDKMEEIDDENSIRQLANMLPNGMTLNALITEKEEDFRDLLQKVAKEINHTFK